VDLKMDSDQRPLQACVFDDLLEIYSQEAMKVGAVMDWMMEMTSAEQ
jgi:hypothetical protein